MTFSSCSDDDKGITPSYEITATYNFENVNYAGQTGRIRMLTELSNYIKTGNDGMS